MSGGDKIAAAANSSSFLVEASHDGFGGESFVVCLFVCFSVCFSSDNVIVGERRMWFCGAIGERKT